MRVVIVGAGVAGAATAWFLAREGVRDVCVCEREPVPGAHATGRSAAMLRRVEPDPVIGGLARAGARFLATPPDGWRGPPLVQATGGLLLAHGAALRGLVGAAAVGRLDGVITERWSVAAIRDRVPALEEAPSLEGVYCTADGVIDSGALLNGFLDGARSAGAEVRFGCPVTGLRRANETVTGVATPAGELDADVVVDAGGAWAGRLLAAAGGTPPPLQPLRRHVFHTAPVGWDTGGWPWVWDVTNGLYFRRESGGLLCSACDEDAVDADDASMAEAAVERLSRTVARAAPALGDVGVARCWPGLRTFAPDRRPVIGWDPRVRGLFWVAGLGGFGLSTAPAIGALAARLITAGADAAGPPALGAARWPARQARE